MKDKSIELSIIVPIYNTEKYLNRCIDSLLNQTIDNYEIILIDDGSNDNSGNICDSYSNKFEFIKTIHKSNEGQGIARNLGIQLARGKYVTFVDSDDYVNKDCYTVMLEIANKDNCDLFIAKLNKCDELEKIKVDCKNIKFKYENNIDNMSAIVCMLNDIGTNQNMWEISSSSCDKLYLKEMLIKGDIKFASERQYISEDIIFNCQAIQNSDNIICSNIPIYNYVQNTGSFCHTYQKDYHKRMSMMKNYFFNNIDLEKNDYVYSSIYIKLFSYLKSCIIQEIEHKKIKNACYGIRNIMKYNDSRNIVENVCIDKLDINNKILIFLLKYNLYYITYIIYSLKLNKQ